MRATINFICTMGLMTILLSTIAIGTSGKAQALMLGDTHAMEAINNQQFQKAFNRDLNKLVGPKVGQNTPKKPQMDARDQAGPRHTPGPLSVPINTADESGC
jgi:hypothetical protein